MVRVASFAPGAAEPSIPDGRIHHWAGAVFIPGVTLDQVLRHLRDRAGRESEAFDDVLSSKLIARDGDRLKIYMKLRRESVITVTYNTEHAVEYRRLNDGASVEPKRRDEDRRARECRHGAGTREACRQRPRFPLAAQRLLALRADQRRASSSNANRRASAASVPLLLRPFVMGTVERIARESLQKTLASLRTDLARVARRAPGALPGK